jgi:ABC-type polysaccharide/polyol phosphate transport system ATPase subunit
MESVITLEHVDKFHPKRRTRAQSLKQLLLSRLRRREVSAEVVTAAQDLCLEVGRGEALGVIGANGAGKTSLLRLIAGITEPTHGTIRTRGRILPLLELGAGFHPDLSGLENIYLQGALLGLPRSRIRELVPAIVGFAELERHIHTPVRHYSDGMYMRLGFSISAHIEPDILLIDESFSVGDLEFQRKCAEKMRAFHAAGGTFLFVSHDMASVEQVCERVIWIDNGRIVLSGAPGEVAQAYQKALFERLYPHPAPLVRSDQISGPHGGRFGSGAVVFDYMEFFDGAGRPCRSFENGAPLELRVRYRLAEGAAEAGKKLGCRMFVQSTRGHGTACVTTEGREAEIRLDRRGGQLIFRIPRLDLAPGQYGIAPLFYNGSPDDLNSVYDVHSRVYSFSVKGPDAMSQIAGLEPLCVWEVIRF